MTATREHVLREFPELADPNWRHPDNTGETNEDMIREWITYWDTMAMVLGQHKPN